MQKKPHPHRHTSEKSEPSTEHERERENSLEVSGDGLEVHKVAESSPGTLAAHAHTST